MIYFSRRRYDDRVIGGSTKERERERERIAENAREFPVETIPDAKTRAVLISKRIKKKWNDLTILVLKKKKEKNFLKKKHDLHDSSRRRASLETRLLTSFSLRERERESENLEARGRLIVVRSKPRAG